MALLYCQGVLPDLEEALCLAAVGTKRYRGWHEIRLRALLQAGRSRYRDRQRRGFGRGSSRFGRRLAGKGKTIAVLGGGADVDYPPNFAGMRKRILENGGAVLSEYPFTTKPYRGNFPSATGLFQGFPGESW